MEQFCTILRKFYNLLSVVNYLFTYTGTRFNSDSGVVYSFVFVHHYWVYITSVGEKKLRLGYPRNESLSSLYDGYENKMGYFCKINETDCARITH